MDRLDTEQVPNSRWLLDGMEDFPLDTGLLESFPQSRRHGIIPLPLLNPALGKHVMPGILAGINEEELGVGEVDAVQAGRVPSWTIANTLKRVVVEGSEENWNTAGNES